MDTEKIAIVHLAKIALKNNRETWRLLGDSYRVHQWVLQAFPERSEGGAGRVLYRVEVHPRSGDTILLVQSTVAPNPEKWQGPVERLPECKCWKLYRDGKPIFVEGQVLRFRVRANPTKKTHPDPNRKNGQRKPLMHETEQIQWLGRKGQNGGFELIPLPNDTSWIDPFAEEPDESKVEVRVTPLNYVTGRKGITENQTQRIDHYGVDFDGVLRVTDPEAFTQTVVQGVGSAKGFGFGLLSLAPAK